MIHKRNEEDIRDDPHPNMYQSPRHLSQPTYKPSLPASYPYEGQHFQAEGVRNLSNNNNI